VSVEISPRARADIDLEAEDLGLRYGQRTADRFIDGLHQLLSRLDGMPASAVEVDPPYPNHPGLRVAQVQGFPTQTVYYVPITTGIRVVRVLHTSRDTDAIFG
jgi:plasmid stabilization system protein ParE